MKCSTLALLIILFLVGEGAQACSIFTLHRGDTVLFANNEDFTKRGVVWFVPGAKKRFGRVNVGFDTGFAQGSMNEKGLAFDGAALQEVPWKKDPKKKNISNLVDRIMDTCTTVEEALALFEEYNGPFLANSQLLFGDQTGASAVVGWHPEGRLSVVRGDGERLLCTNNRLEASSYRCKRYVKAGQVLDTEKGDPVEAARKALEAIHQRGAGFTSYSTIYNLREQTFLLYNLGNFKEVVRFDLSEELAKGKHKFEMISLFEASPELDTVHQGPREYETRINIPVDILKRFAGHYEPDGMPGVVIAVELVDGELKMGQAADEKRMPLVPESEYTFRFADDSGQVRFTEEGTPQGAGFIIMRGGDHFARRLSE